MNTALARSGHLVPDSWRLELEVDSEDSPSLAPTADSLHGQGRLDPRAAEQQVAEQRIAD